MHGNNGSIDGDGAAAMRYTECRLSRFGQTMIENIDKNTVELILKKNLLYYLLYYLIY